MPFNGKSRGIWDSTECALALIDDYEENMLGLVFQHDRRVVELNARFLTSVALEFKIPVILSTAGVELGLNSPTVSSLREALPNIKVIDRTSMNAWEDPKFFAAVQATGRKRLVMAGIFTSVCLAYPAVAALADGYEVCFSADASADTSTEAHDTAVLRLTHAGAVPNTTAVMVQEWFRDWKSPLADSVKKVIVPYYQELAALKRAPEYQQPRAAVLSGAVQKV
jgi:nicotinamidase-related amidase